MYLNFLYRKKNPSFFSIEKVFGIITEKINDAKTNDFNIKKIELPFRSSNLIFLALNMLFILPKRKGLFHITGDIHYVLCVLPKKRTVLTIHDLVFLHTHKGFIRWFLKWIYVIMPVQQARYITTISEKSKSEIIEFTNCSPDKIRVIPNPVDVELKYHKKHFNHDKPRILFLGTKSNKNLELCILSLYNITIHLRIIGELTQLQKDTLLKYNIEYSNAAELSTEHIHNEFIDCDMVLFPSTYEGFGLPVIEAFKSGRPVITSDIAPMNQIADGAALLVNPASVPSIRKAILSLIENDHLRSELVEKGFEVVKHYEAEAIANQYIALWSEIAEKNGI